MTAVDQISRGAQQQAAATQEASAAMNQVERTAAIVPRERRRHRLNAPSEWMRCSANAGRRLPTCRRG